MQRDDERVEKSPVHLSDGEKLSLLMLCEIYKHLKIKGEIDPEFVESAIHDGHLWGLQWKYPGIYHGHEDSKSVVTEVLDVLDMWSFLERAHGKLTKADKDRVEKEAAPFGKKVVFPGFDGNNEGEQLSIAHFLIKDLDRFSSFGGRELNSHMPSMDMYRRMWGVFEPIRLTLMDKELSASQIIGLLREMTHPDRRPT
jgi:hypothetical protein